MFVCPTECPASVAPTKITQRATTAIAAKEVTTAIVTQRPVVVVTNPTVTRPKTT